MKFLINPSEREILNDAGDRMPLGLLYLANSWKDTNVYDLNHTTFEELLDDVKHMKPELIGVSCLTSPLVEKTKELCRELRNQTKARIVVGGYHPSVIPKDFIGVADSVVVGEAEEVKKFEDFIIRAPEVNLSNLRPERENLDPSRYNMQINGLRASTAITSRGCPNACTFCGNLTRKVRYHDLADVAADLETIKSQGYEAVYFLDDVFTINKQRAKEIGTMTKDIGLKYRATTRANYTDEDLIGHMARTGCVCLSMGIESGNEGILRKVGKNQTKDHIRNAVGLAGKYHIPVKGFFIIGLPGETEETAKETIKFSKELYGLGMKSADFYSLIPFPGTRIWTNPEEQGLEIIDRNYAHYLQASRNEPYVPVETKELNTKRIKQLIMRARKEWKD